MTTHPRIRSCRVCGCTDDRACVDPVTGIACHWLPARSPADDICSACEGARDHVLSMTFDNGTGERVGTCSCGNFEARATFKVGGEAYAKIDAAVIEHWRSAAGRTDL